MGKHKKQSKTSDERGLDSASKNSAKPNDISEKMDRISSQLLDMCSQKSGQNAAANLLWQEHLQIRQKVDELRSYQSHATANIFPQSDEKQRRFELLEIMAEWCRRNGTKTTGVAISSFDGDDNNCGLRMEKTAEVGDLVVVVPRRIFLSLENVLSRNEAARKMFESDPLLKGMPNVALTVLVAIEKLKGAESFWHPYLNSLPPTYSTPLYFLVDGSEKLAETLRGSVAFEETLKLYKNIVRQYAYFYQMVSSSPNFVPSNWRQLLTPSNFVFDLYVWAAVTVMTRINFVPAAVDCGERKEANTKPANAPALIPFFDMGNHGDVPSCTDFIGDDEEDGGQCAVIYASIRYQSGDQLLINYGERKYWEFFVYNGFIYDDGRRYPNATIKLGLSGSDRTLSLKTEALRRYGLGPSEQFTVCKYALDANKAPFPISMEHFAIVFAADKEELESFCSSDAEPGRFSWSAKTVLEARKFLITRLSLLTRAYALKRDRVTDDEGTEPSAIEQGRMTMVLAFVGGEMETLTSCINFLETQCH